MKLHNFTKILNFRVISRKKEFQQQQPAADDDAECFFCKQTADCQNYTIDQATLYYDNILCSTFFCYFF